MILPSNPYAPGTPVPQTPAFVGRQQPLAEIFRRLNESESPVLLLVGPRRIGKTSFLRYLANHLPERGPFRPVYLDPSAAGPGGPSAIFRRLSRKLARELGMPALAETNPDPDWFPGELARRLATGPDAAGPDVTGTDAAGRLVLLLDEPALGTGREGAQQAREVYRTFLQFLNAVGAPAIGILAMGRRADDLDALRADLPASAPVLRIGCLTAAETERLIRRSEHGGDLVWPDGEVAAVLDQTGGHPFLTQLLCHRVWAAVGASSDGEAVADGEAVESGAVRRAADRVLAEVEPLLIGMWRALGPAERAVAALLAGDAAVESPEVLSERLLTGGLYHPNGDLNRVLERLADWELLHHRGGRMTLGIRMIREWIAAHKPAETVRAELEGMAEEHFRIARAKFQAKDWTAAEQRLRRVLALFPDHRHAAVLLARLLIARRRTGEAVALLEPLYEFRFPELQNLYVQALVAHAVRMAKDEDARLALYETALDIDPEAADAQAGKREILEARGDRVRELGDAAGALALYREAGAEEKIREVEESLGVLHRLRNRRKRRWKKAAIWLAGTSAVALLLSGAAAFGVYAAYRHLSEDLPRIDSLTDYQPPEVTTVFAADGRTIGEFYRERRYVVGLDEMPAHLINAFIATEDARYFSHEGLDPVGILRAFFKNIEAGSIVQGGSTITQQVIKSFLLTPERSYRRKMREAILAYRIDKAFGKEEILFLYLNQIFLGEGAYGVEGAARTYFDKSAADLTLPESALLAGLAKAPSRDSPLRNPEAAVARRGFVLDRMRIEGYITPADAEAARKAPLALAPRRNLFREEVPFFTEQVRRELARDYGYKALYTGGLRVYTTVNRELQAAARQAVREGLAALESRHRYPGERHPEGALVCLEPETGRVLALVGGRDFDDSQFNRAVQARRQPGSAFKPIIYAAALDAGFTPMTVLWDSPLSVPDNGEWWRPSNYDGRFDGPIRLRRALARSRNVPVVRVLQSIGIDYAIDYARQLGISSRLNRGLSLALGASGVSLLELANAYGVFANHGNRVEPVFIERVVDRNGNVISPDPPPPIAVMEPATAFLMTDLLQEVVNRGTGVRVKKLGRPAAGKTGTTNDFRDAWFLGYTPDFIAGAWVGFDVERPLGSRETGSKAASPIWLSFMETAHEGLPVREFPPPPEGVVYAEMDLQTGYRPGPYTASVAGDWFKKGTEPGPAPVRQRVVTEPEDFFKAGL
jgi:penicillin-binding protein 1A